jgi:hypothetical protein
LELRYGRAAPSERVRRQDVDRRDGPVQKRSADGYTTDVFIGAWIDSDQIDLNLPPEFSRECGRLGLPVSLITND